MNPIIFANFYGISDWMIIAAIVLVLFGGAKIPQLARGVGEGIREFKKSVNPDADDEVKSSKEDDKKDADKEGLK